MTAERFTPGPWHYIGGAIYADAAGTIAIAHAYREVDAVPRPTERDANARLMAAAPELLRAARGVMRDGLTVNWRGDLEDAVDKALGRLECSNCGEGYRESDHVIVDIDPGLCPTCAVGG